ncbi:MAG: hypothetical protein IJ168_00230 [Eubacterium sp.]|nr:hypothetical protein [Eubacterium sp.]
MAFESLFIRSVVLERAPEPNKINVHIPLLNINDPSGISVIALDVIPCDEGGENYQFDRAMRVSLEAFNHQNRRFQLPASAEGDTYYRIAPVIFQNGEHCRVQLAPEDDKTNIVKVVQVKIPITYSFTPQVITKNLFGKIKSVTPAELVINCDQELAAGTIGYVMNGFFFPLPAVVKTARISMAQYSETGIQLEFRDSQMANSYVLIGG